MTRRTDWAVVSDVDGTLVPKRNGALVKIVDDGVLPESANIELVALRAHYLAKIAAGLLTHLDEMIWLQKTLEMYVQHRVTRQAGQSALDGVALRDGVVETFRLLADAGVPVAAISHGCADFVEYVLGRHGLRLDAVYACRLVHDGDVVIGYDTTSIVVPAYKGDRSRHFADTQGVPHEGLIAVGDTHGDRFLGHEKDHRIGIAETEEDEQRLHATGAMGEVHRSETFHPILDSIKRRLGLP